MEGRWRHPGFRATTRWRRWLVCAMGLVVLSGIACENGISKKNLAMEPIGTVKPINTTQTEDKSDGGVVAPNSGTPSKDGPCIASEFDNLEDVFRTCEVAMPKASDVPQVKDKLDVKVTMSSATTTPGGRVDVQIVLRNKTSEPLPIYFTGDPTPHFDLEAVDSKGRRADLPSSKWPGYPKGYKPEAREAKASRVTLDKNGSAKLRLTWDAVKTKWAPDKAKSWEGRGFPRSPSGPLPPGKYMLRLVLPLIGDVDVPKVPIEVSS
jgi:hypothetical protein